MINLKKPFKGWERKKIHFTSKFNQPSADEKRQLGNQLHARKKLHFQFHTFFSMSQRESQRLAEQLMNIQALECK